MFVLIQNNAVAQYPYTLEALKQANPQVSFPSAPSSTLMASYGMFPVVSVGQPVFDATTHKVIETNPVYANARWQQAFSVTALSELEIAALEQTHWAAIQAIRNTKTQQGGFPVAGKWFHSDTFSRTQQIGLTMMGANIPAGLQWKTLDGTFVTMTPTLAGQIFASAAQQDAAIFAHAEVLKAQGLAANINVGWPVTYGGV